MERFGRNWREEKKTLTYKSEYGSTNGKITKESKGRLIWTRVKMPNKIIAIFKMIPEQKTPPLRCCLRVCKEGRGMNRTLSRQTWRIQMLKSIRTTGKWLRKKRRKFFFFFRFGKKVFLRSGRIEWKKKEILNHRKYEWVNPIVSVRSSESEKKINNLTSSTLPVRKVGSGTNNLNY